MLGAATTEAKLEELRAHVMDHFHEVHGAAADRDSQLQHLTHKVEHLERQAELYEARLQTQELDVAEAVVRIRDTFLKVDEGLGEAALRLRNLDAGCDKFYKEVADQNRALTVELARLHKTDEDLFDLVTKHAKTYEAQGRRLAALECEFKLGNAKAKLEPDSENKVDAGAAKQVFEDMDALMTEIEGKNADLEKQVQKANLRSRWPRGLSGKACGPFVCGEESCGS